ASRSSSAASIWANSSSVSSPARFSTRACAREPARSYGASRQSKWTDRDRAASASDGPPAKRPPHSRVLSVNAGLHRRIGQRALVGRRGCFERGDLLGAALLDSGRLELTEQVGPAQLAAEAGVLLELGPRVADVEVAHGQLADPVDRPERGVLGAFHGQ